MRCNNTLFTAFLFALISWISIHGRKLKRQSFTGPPRPNIIFVLTDDLDVTLGSPLVMKKTKRILQEEGVTFENAFTASPICCPSRSSILTGRYTHNHGVHGNTDKHCYSQEWIDGPERENFGKFMQDGGYETAYFGKYLNNYDGAKIPIGWNYWHGLIKNSRYYNYSVNINGRIERHGDDYEKDYFTDVITTAGINYFKKMKRSYNSKPVMMVLSMSAPHGSEDGAPQYQNHFPDVQVPRDPHFNYTSKDKHWVIRQTPPLNNLTEKFVDQLHRKRLQTLLSVDDAVEKLYIMLLKTRQLYNTYIVFSSDHGYHLGHFNQVKGKSQPYEPDIRIPLYMRGPAIPRGVTVPDIALNIDFAPTFLDIARLRVPKYFDGQSLMDPAVGSVVNKMKGKLLKPIWRDSFLVSRGKLLPKRNETVIKTNTVGKSTIIPSVRNIQKECMKHRYPKPPCTSRKEIVCYTIGNTWYLQRCQGRDKIKSAGCYCPKATEGFKISVDPTSIEMYENATNNEINILLVQLERQFERLKRRIKRHGVKYLTKYSIDDITETPAEKPDYVKEYEEMQQKQQQKNQTKNQEEEDQKQQGDKEDKKNDETKSDKKIKFGQLVDKKIMQTQKRLEYWQSEKSKLALNRELSKRLAVTLAERIKTQKSKPKTVKTENSPCYCNHRSQNENKKNEIKLSKKEKKKREKKNKKQPRYMNCFYMSKSHWKTPPVWKHDAFTACTNAPNSSYWCLRTINKTHNFLYCEFVTGFKEYFDINKDPYQLKNIASTIPTKTQQNLHRLIVHLKQCEGSKECFVLAGETLSDRKDVLRKIRRYDRKKRHGKFVRGTGQILQRGSRDTSRID